MMMLIILRRCRFLTLHRCGAGHETGCRHTILCPALHSLDSYALQFHPIVALLTACSWHARRQNSLISPKPGPRSKQSDKCTTYIAYKPVTNRDVPRSKKARRADNPVRHKPYSSISVAIEIMTDEMHQINYLDGLDELIEAINLQTDGPREAARAIRKKLQYGSVHCQLHALCILEALVEEAGPKFRSSFLNRRLWKRLRFCARADLSSPRVKEKCRVIFRSWNIKYSSTPGLAVLCSIYHVSCFNRNEVVEALTCCCSKFLVLTVLLKQRSEAGAVVSQKLLFNFWLRGCQH